LIDVHETRTPSKPSTTCRRDGPTSGASSLTGWKVDGATKAHLTLRTVPSALGTMAGTLQAAFNAWRQPGVPRITVATDGFVTVPTPNHRYEIMWGRTGGATLAVTYTWLWSDGIVESDTLFNTRVRWAVLPNDPDGCEKKVSLYDVGNIATHEFGHAYGLGHVADRFATMYPVGYTGETLKRTPADGDLAGINSIY
jgi:hypothetical protein